MSEKKAEELRCRIKRLQRECTKFMISVRPENFKSKYVTCENCGSKIRKDLFVGKTKLECPACHALHISETTKKRFISFKDRMETAMKLLAIEEKKSKKKKYDKELVDTFDDAFQHKYLMAHDVGYDCWDDDATKILLYKGAKLEDDDDGKCGDSGKMDWLPHYFLDHEEEKYGNDTHGWSAMYLGSHGDKFLACKESYERALQACRKHFTENRSKIEQELKDAQDRRNAA